MRSNFCSLYCNHLERPSPIRDYVLCARLLRKSFPGIKRELSPRFANEKRQGWHWLFLKWSIKKKLDQVYCAWLIKWIIKREIIQLCLRWWIKSDTSRYLVVLGQYKLVLLGFMWYRVNRGLICLYILKKKWGVGRVSPMPRRHTDNRI